MVITTIFLVIFLVILISLVLYSSKYVTHGYTNTNNTNATITSFNPSVNCRSWNTDSRGWWYSSAVVVNAFILTVIK